MMIDKKKIKYGAGILGLSVVMATSGLALQGCKKNENRIGSVTEISDEDITKDNINEPIENKESGMKEAAGAYNEMANIDLKNLKESERSELKEMFSIICVVPEIVSNEKGEQGLKLPKDYAICYVGEETPCGFWSVEILEDGSEIVYPANGVLEDGRKKVYTVDNYIAIPKQVNLTEEQLVEYPVIKDVLKEIYTDKLLFRSELKESFSPLCVVPEIVSNEKGEQGLKLHKDYAICYVGEKTPCGFLAVEILGDGSKIVYPATEIHEDGKIIYTVDNYVAIPKEVCPTEEQLVADPIIRDVLKEIYDEQKENDHVSENSLKSGRTYQKRSI